MLIVVGLALAACSRGDADTGPRPASTAAPAAASGQSLPAAPVDSVKLVVDSAGLYRVTAAELAAAGFDLAGQDLSQLSLTAGGAPVALAVDGSGDDATLTFYGQPRDSRYGTQNVYWLNKAATDGTPARITSGDASPGNATPASTFRASQHVEQSNHYLSQVTDTDDHWLWESLFAPATFTVTFDLPGYAGGDADLAVSLWGNSEDRSDPDHSAILRLNGAIIGESTWDGKGWKTLTETVSAANLLPVGNELALELPGDTEAVVDMVYLNQVDVNYDSYLALTGQRTAGIHAAGRRRPDDHWRGQPGCADLGCHRSADARGADRCELTARMACGCELLRVTTFRPWLSLSLPACSPLLRCCRATAPICATTWRALTTSP